MHNSRVSCDGTWNLTSNHDTYKQTYIISIKHTINAERVFVVPIVIELFKNKSYDSYIFLIQKIKQIFQDTYPNMPPLKFESVTSDYEQAFIKAIEVGMPDSKILLCIYHFFAK